MKSTGMAVLTVGAPLRQIKLMISIAMTSQQNVIVRMALYGMNSAMGSVWNRTIVWLRAKRRRTRQQQSHLLMEKAVERMRNIAIMPVLTTIAGK